MLMAILGFLGIGPTVNAFSDVLGSGVKVLVDTGFLPLASILIEPAKILFLNNAINFGVLAPIGAVEAEETGKSIMFMLESNPGPGLVTTSCILVGRTEDPSRFSSGCNRYPLPWWNPRNLTSHTYYLSQSLFLQRLPVVQLVLLLSRLLESALLPPHHQDRSSLTWR